MVVLHDIIRLLSHSNFLTVSSFARTSCSPRRRRTRGSTVPHCDLHLSSASKPRRSRRSWQHSCREFARFPSHRRRLCRTLTQPHLPPIPIPMTMTQSHFPPISVTQPRWTRRHVMVMVAAQTGEPVPQATPSELACSAVCDTSHQQDASA